jgi:alpha-1,2-mannosyltransferase
MQRHRRIAIVAGLLLAVAVLLYFNAPWHDFFDLKVYYGAINGWLHDGTPLYDWVKPHSKYGFTYPPVAAVLMAPMAVVSWPVAVTINLALTVVATGLVIHWLGEPIFVRYPQVPSWFAYSVAALLVLAFEPVRETLSFGQINLLLLALVLFDVKALVRGRGWAGAGIGLAAAIKLTPGIFVVYLLVTRRWRAAAIAAAVGTVVTVLAAAIVPRTSLDFWTGALLDTDRVGSLSFVSNQSLRGVTARINPAHPSMLLWLLGVVVVVAIWFVRVRRTHQSGDVMGGVALTAVLGCLLSPVTWVHHLVWLMPALAVTLGRTLAMAPSSRRTRLLGFVAGAYGILCSRLVWFTRHHVRGLLSFVTGSGYVWVSIALLILVPIGDERPAVADLEENRVRRDARGVLGDHAVEGKTVPLVEAP